MVNAKQSRKEAEEYPDSSPSVHFIFSPNVHKWMNELKKALKVAPSFEVKDRLRTWKIRVFYQLPDTIYPLPLK